MKKTNKSDIANRKMPRQIVASAPVDIQCGVNNSWDQKLLITCPICFIRFHRPPSHVARVATSYCSRGCAAEGRIVRVVSNCVGCGEAMELVPSMVGKKTTCSKKCSTLRRAKGPGKLTRNFSAVSKRVKEIQKRGKCINCGGNHGPWAVRGLYGEMQPDGEVVIDGERAELWCSHCHLTDIAPLGPAARDAGRPT
jgi:hypothetical protein